MWHLGTGPKAALAVLGGGSLPGRDEWRITGLKGVWLLESSPGRDTTGGKGLGEPCRSS